jgi:hypothetical protein
VCSAFAQDTANQVTSRTYRFTGPAPSARDYQELATVIRTVGDARDVNLDAEAGQIAFSGRGEVPEMSEWLLRQLDKAPGARPSEAPEFHSAQKDDNVAVFYAAHATGPRYMQEVLTVLRTVADVQKLFSYRALNALAVRGPAAQIALTKWMVESMDKAAPIAVSKTPEFHLSGVRDDTIRIYYLANARGADINRILTAVRVTGGIQKTFAVAENGALAIRGRLEDMVKAEGILLSMDQQLAH